MTNTEFKINDFTGFATTVKYAGLLHQMISGYDDNGKLIHCIGLKDQENINKFIQHMQENITNNFYDISALAKTLYYCDRKELNEMDINTVLGLIVSLSEINAWIHEESRDLTEHNTIPMPTIG